MNLNNIFKVIIYIILGTTGLFSIYLPFVSYKKAYFVGEDYYVGMVDSIENQYNPFIDEIIQKGLTIQASKEKKILYNKLKPVADSLGLLQSKAEISGDSSRIISIKKVIDKFTAAKYERESEIDEKYSLDNLGKTKLTDIKKAIKDTLKVKDYVAIVANKLRNPNQRKSIKPITAAEINIQKVNEQDKGGFIIFGVTLIVVVIFIALVEENIIQLHLSPLKYALIIVLFGFSMVMLYLIRKSLIDDIRFKEIFEEREKVVKERLLKIKNLEIEYLSIHNKYCDNLDSLVQFAKNAQSPVERYLVDKNDTAAVNNALRAGLPLKDTTYIAVDKKVFGANHTVKLDSLPYVPFSKQKFDIKVKQYNEDGRVINLILVQTLKKTFVENLAIYPENFDEEKTLHFGSLADPTTNGNWE